MQQKIDGTQEELLPLAVDSQEKKIGVQQCCVAALSVMCFTRNDDDAEASDDVAALGSESHHCWVHLIEGWRRCMLVVTVSKFLIRGLSVCVSKHKILRTFAQI